MIRPKIRLAQNSDAPVIQAILENAQLVPLGLDWSEVYPFWLIAEWRGEIVGCAQILVGKPLGHIGFVAIVPEYQSYGVGVILWKAAERFLARSDSDGYTGMTIRKDILKHWTKKMGGIVFGDPVSLLMKRIYRKKVIKDEVLQEDLH